MVLNNYDGGETEDGSGAHSRLPIYEELRTDHVCVLQNLYALRRKVKWQDQLQWDSMRSTATWY